MTLTKPSYKSRIVDKKIEEYLSIFGAVLIEGPKWCGKTWTMLNHAESVVYLMDPAGNYSIREAARMNPASILGGAAPSAIDEWQEVPGIWDAVRFEVDQNREKGRYLLTGSTRPINKKPLHSGAGRIARLRMRTMSLFESGDSNGKASLSALFSGEEIPAFSNPVELDRLIQFAIRGGWPENLEIPETKASIIPEQYLSLIASSDISKLDDDTRRDPVKVELLLRAFARNTASQVSNATLQQDIQNDANSLSMPTIQSYLTALKSLFVIEEAPGWRPAIRSRTRIQTTPKRFFTDPSLAVAGLRTSHRKLREDLSAFGGVFENLCYRDLAIYAEAIDGNVYHYRDNSNLEVDVIIERNDGGYGAFEIKLNPDRADEGVKSLKRFAEKMTEKGVVAPACLAVITGGGIGKKREDGVYVIPITALKP
jgi:predicted AAA+ superfamily ATPase